MRTGPRRGETAILVISPTRELAAQIAVEAKALSTFHGLTTQVRCGEPINVWLNVWLAEMHMPSKSACHVHLDESLSLRRRRAHCMPAAAAAMRLNSFSIADQLALVFAFARSCWVAPTCPSCARERRPL